LFARRPGGAAALNLARRPVAGKPLHRAARRARRTRGSGWQSRSRVGALVAHRPQRPAHWSARNGVSGHVRASARRAPCACRARALTSAAREFTNHHLAERGDGMTTAIRTLGRAMLLPAACAGALACAAAPQPDLAPAFGDVQGTFVLLDLQTGERVVHNAERARTGFIPAST